MSYLAAGTPALLGLVFTIVLICFPGFAIYRLNTKIVVDSSRRLVETDAATQEMSDLTKLLQSIIKEAEEKTLVIQEKDAAINDKDAIINKKEAVIEEKDALIEVKELAISNGQLQITNLTQCLGRGAVKAQSDQGEIRNLKLRLKNATASARKAVATENTVINQNAAERDKMAMANQIIKDLQASLAAAGREAHEWRTEAYIAIVRKMPPSQRGLSLYGMEPRNFMPRVRMTQAHNPSESLFGPDGAPSFSYNSLPYALGPMSDTCTENWVVRKDCPREGREPDQSIAVSF